MRALTGVLIAAAVAAAGGYWLGQSGLVGGRAIPAAWGDARQAVILTNGQAFFGRIREVRRDFVILSDVFYVQSQVKPETKEVKSVLIQRGNELHAPREMAVNRSSILMIEPVGADSTVAKLIEQHRERKQN